jgi:hypothetical protein
MSFEQSVFINCPFDKSYIDDLLKPTLYVLVKNEFSPRLSLEVSDSGQIRLQKITEIIKSCKYSIHDLSIVKSKKANEFARMNMPFELGIDYGLRNSGMSEFNEKQFLILEATKYDYMKAISDINGIDIKVHSNETSKIFDCLYSWLSETLKINKQNPPLKMFYDYQDFNKSLFNEKFAEFGSDDLAKNYIEKISIPEYIGEIRERI